jgi:hypothetical protein
MGIGAAQAGAKAARKAEMQQAYAMLTEKYALVNGIYWQGYSKTPAQPLTGGPLRGSYRRHDRGE